MAAPAGYEAALVAVQYGAEVTLIERDGIGGACVLSDCVPSKTFIASAGGRTSVRAADSLGVMVDPDKVGVDVSVVHGPGGRARAGAVRRHPQPLWAPTASRWSTASAALSDTQPGRASHRVDGDRPGRRRHRATQPTSC